MAHLFNQRVRSGRENIGETLDSWKRQKFKDLVPLALPCSDAGRRSVYVTSAIVHSDLVLSGAARRTSWERNSSARISTNGVFTTGWSRTTPGDFCRTRTSRCDADGLSGRYSCAIELLHSTGQSLDEPQAKANSTPTVIRPVYLRVLDILQIDAVYGSPLYALRGPS